jgi:hypothetical protein
MAILILSDDSFSADYDRPGQIRFRFAFIDAIISAADR